MISQYTRALLRLRELVDEWLIAVAISLAVGALSLPLAEHHRESRRRHAEREAAYELAGLRASFEEHQRWLRERDGRTVARSGEARARRVQGLSELEAGRYREAMVSFTEALRFDSLGELGDLADLFKIARSLAEEEEARKKRADAPAGQGEAER